MLRVPPLLLLLLDFHPTGRDSGWKPWCQGLKTGQFHQGCQCLKGEWLVHQKINSWIITVHRFTTTQIFFPEHPIKKYFKIYQNCYRQNKLQLIWRVFSLKIIIINSLSLQKHHPKQKTTKKQLQKTPTQATKHPSLEACILWNNFSKYWELWACCLRFSQRHQE